MDKYFPRYLITMVKQAIQIEPIKYMGGNTCLFVLFFHVQKMQSICDKIAFVYFTQILFRENNSPNSREGVQF